MKKLFPVIGAFIGLVIAFLLRPSFAASLTGNAAIDKPSLFMMFECGISPCNNPAYTSASRFGLIYLIVGIIAGALISLMISRLGQAKNVSAD